MIKVTCEVQDYSNPAKTSIRIHNHWSSNKQVEIEVDGERRTVNGKDLIEAVNNCMNTNYWG